MVRYFLRHTLCVPVGLIAVAFAGCSSDSDPADPVDCGAQCVEEGGACIDTLNCVLPLICNLPSEVLFDPDETEGTCISVTCADNDDCDAGEVCGPDMLCRAQLCQVNGDCTGNDVCVSGVCEAPPPASSIESCSVSTRDGSITTGATVTLTASAKNAAGETLGRVAFTWASDNADAVSVAGDMATGGATGGAATITAEVTGGVACEGSATITNFLSAPAESVRVVVVEDGVGAPVADATVVVIEGATVSTASTAADGSVTFAGATAGLDSVTVEKDGWQLFTVIAPGTADIYIPLPRDNDNTVAGGIRGVLDLSRTTNDAIKFGFAGPAIPSNLLDFGAESLIGDILPTDTSALAVLSSAIPEELPLPTGTLLTLADSQITAGPERCVGPIVPGPDDLGCYLTRMAPGPSASWALGGQVAIGDLTSLITELSGLLGGGTADIPITDILEGVLPLLRLFNHGVNTSVTTEQFPKVAVPGQSVDCSDADLPNYDEVCIANFSQYAAQDMILTQPLSILSTVDMPDLPLTQTSTCTSGAVVLAASFVDGRGLVPLGLGAGLLREGSTTSNCVVGGVSNPFGPGTPALNDGELALSLAPPHSGLEGSQTVLLSLALDIDGLVASGGDGFQVSAVLNRVDRVEADQTVTGTFPAFPTGTVDKGDAEVTFTSPVNGITVTRTEINQGGRTWLIYAPAQATVALPDVATGRSILADADGAVILTINMASSVSYDDVWTLASGSTIDRLFDIIDGFVVTDCPDDDPNAACRLED